MEGQQTVNWGGEEEEEESWQERLRSGNLKTLRRPASE